MRRKSRGRGASQGRRVVSWSKSYHMKRLDAISYRCPWSWRSGGSKASTVGCTIAGVDPPKARIVSKRVPFGELDRTPRVTIIVNHILIHEGIEEVVMRLTPVLARERQARTARSTIVSSLSTFADYPVERLP